MSHAEIGARSERCICPETTFTSGPTAAEVEACRQRSPWLHQVLGSDEIAAIVAIRKNQLHD